MTQEHVEQLKDCYEAVLVRRVERGVGSIRTRSGYSQLRTKYQARLRFLQDPTLLSAQAPQPGETSSLVEAAVPLEADTGDQHESAELQTEEERLRSVVGAYFDQRIKRLISDICWPMAHFGGSDAPLGSVSASSKPQQSTSIGAKALRCCCRSQSGRSWNRTSTLRSCTRRCCGSSRDFQELKRSYKQRKTGKRTLSLTSMEPTA